jgi:PIN domain nuclease of toxin-antitoxin system
MIVLDTHALIWWIDDQDQLSTKAQRAIKRAQEKNAIYISAISIWEIAMLVKKKRLKLNMDVETWTSKIVDLPMVNCVDVSPEIALKSVNLPNFSHPDPADRIIISTAQTHGMKLVTKDKKIIDYKSVTTVW